MTTLNPVRVYFDNDGVFNCPKPTWENGSEVSPVRTGNGTFNLQWAPDLVDAINSLEGIEFVWLTTWCDEATELLNPLYGIKHQTRVLQPLSGRISFPSLYWKAESLRAEQAASPSRFIWLDDEHGDFSREMGESMGGLVPKIDWHTGITPEIVQQMRDYIAAA